MTTRTHSASPAAQAAVLRQLQATADAHGLTTVTNDELVAALPWQRRTVEYAIRNLRDQGSIALAFTREKGARVIKVL